MKTDSELEALLRTTLANRAATVLDAPAPPAAAPARPQRIWLPALAAAAAVVIAVTGVLLGIHLSKGSPPAHPTPKPTPTPVPSVCRTTLPAAWRAALGHSALETRGRTTQVLSIAPDGSVLAIQDDGPQPGAGRFLVRLSPGHQPDVVLDIPDPDHLTVAIAQQYQHWLLVGYRRDSRPAKGTIPGSSPLGLAKLEVLDLEAHDTHTLYHLNIRQTGPASHSNAAVIYDGRVYWDEAFGKSGSVRSYDLATGQQGTVYTGPIGYTVLRGDGVGISLGAGAFTTVVHARLPQPVAAAMTPFARGFLTTDGSAYAWLASMKAPNTLVVGWWAPGQDAPLYRRLTPGDLYVESGTAGITVAGRYLVTVLPGGGGRLVDMVTGAVATLPEKYAGTTRPQFYLSRAGELAGGGFTERDGHYINGYWADAAGTVLRLDTNALPPLTC